MQDRGSINHPISALKVFLIVPVKFAHGNYEKDNFETSSFCIAKQGMIQILGTFE